MSKSLLQCAVEDSRDAQKKFGHAVAVLSVLIGIGIAGWHPLVALLESFSLWLGRYANTATTIQERMETLNGILMNPVGLYLVGMAFLANLIWLGRSKIIFDATAANIENGEEFDEDSLLAEVRKQQRFWRGLAWASFFYCFVLGWTSMQYLPHHPFPHWFPLWLLCSAMAGAATAAGTHVVGYIWPYLYIRQKLDVAIERSKSHYGYPD
jgi:hypothetical protein